MTKTSVTSRFLAGFEPLVLPPRGPDGMIPAGPPSPSSATQCPSLCEAGPCRHYHKLATIMDAQRPIVGLGPMRRMVTRACYPTLGIELELAGEEPVLQCSRWEPDNEQGRLGELRKQYLKTADGKAFADKIAAFEESSVDLAAQEQADIDEAALDQLVHDGKDEAMRPVSIAAKPADEATRDQLARDSYKVTP